MSVGDLHHQLADRAAIAELGNRLAAIFEREHFADMGIDLALIPQAEEMLDMRLKKFTIRL